MIQRKTLLILAGAIFAWFNVGFVLWLKGGDSLTARFAHAWQAASSDWLVVIILSDALVFVVFVLAWLWRDARARMLTTRRRIGWVVATVALGSPALLVYLAYRPHGRAEPESVR